MMNTLAEADAFVKQARANGSITSVQGAAAEYAARKQAAAQARGQWIEQQEAAEAAFVQEIQAEQKRRDAEAQARQQAFDLARWKQEDFAEGARWEAQQAYQRYRQGERADPQPKSLWRGEYVEEPKSWWQQFVSNFITTATSPRDAAARVAGSIPDAWRGFQFLPLQVRKQIKGSNLVISVNQKTLNIVNSVTGWMEKNIPWTGIKTVPSNKLGYYEQLAEQGLDIKPTGNLSPKKWTDRLLDIVFGKGSKTLVKEVAEETSEAATKGGLRNALKTVSPSMFDVVIEGVFNAYDYTLGEKKNETDKLQKWAVSSGVDLGASLLTGALAVGITALIVVALTTISATGAIALTIIIGAVLDMVLEATGVKDVIKTNLNNFIDSAQSLPEPTAVQPAVPIPTSPPAPQMDGTPTPSPALPTTPPVEPWTAPAQTPSTPTPQTPEA